MLNVGSIFDGTSPQILSHCEWLRLRKLMAAKGLSPLLGLELSNGAFLLGSYTQQEAAGLVRCTLSDISVLETVGAEARADLAAGRVTMAQLRLRYSLRNGGTERALEEIGAQRLLQYLDDLTAPAPR